MIDDADHAVTVRVHWDAEALRWDHDAHALVTGAWHVAGVDEYGRTTSRADDLAETFATWREAMDYVPALRRRLDIAGMWSGPRPAPGDRDDPYGPCHAVLPRDEARGYYKIRTPHGLVMVTVVAGGTSVIVYDSPYANPIKQARMGEPLRYPDGTPIPETYA